MKAGELVSGSFGALLLALRTVSSNREQQGESTTMTAKVETVGGAPETPPVVEAIPTKKDV
jgi:hypothetical protein